MSASPVIRMKNQENTSNPPRLPRRLRVTAARADERPARPLRPGSSVHLTVRRSQAGASGKARAALQVSLRPRLLAQPEERSPS